MHSIRTMALGERARALLQPPSARLRWGLASVYAVVGLWVVSGARARPATLWMAQYELHDFQSAADLWIFLQELRTGIPPLLALAEIGEYLATGDTFLVDAVFYRATLLVAFALPFLAFPRTRIETLLSFGLALVFLTAARHVVTPNAQLYDPLLPALLLGYVACIDAARRRGAGAGAFWRVALAGALLSAAELTRPFVLLLLPVLLGWAWLALRGFPRRTAVALLIPLLLLSGGWHAKLLWMGDGQVLWSNHGGFNLQRAWSDRIEAWPPVQDRTRDPDANWEGKRLRGSGQYRVLRLDTPTRTRESRALTRTVLAHMVRQPLDSALHVAHGVAALLAPQTQLLLRPLVHPVRGPYRVLVPLASLALGVNALLLLARVLRRRDLRPAATADGALLVTAASLIVLIALGERGEEARFVVSILPFLAALPRGFGPTDAAPDARQSRATPASSARERSRDGRGGL